MAKKQKLTPASVGRIIEKQEAKIKEEAEDIRTKYPEIAKMTVAEVVATDEFTKQLEKAIVSYRVVNYYAFQSLKRNKTLEPENFKKEFIACMDKESNMPYAKRIIILEIGNDAYKRTVLEMMKEYDTKNIN